MKQFTHGSLFAGIGGFDLGFERAGIKTVWQVEIDPFCRRVLERHFPDAERFDDIRGCGRHNLAGVDVITGGFPCQDVSHAGKRAGIEGERSGLWAEMWRILCELRPRIVVVENVPGLLHRGIERVLGDLAAGGFDAEWDCLPAVAFGAPHRRDRIFILAYANTSRFGRANAANEIERSAIPGGRPPCYVAGASRNEMAESAQYRLQAGRHGSGKAEASQNSEAGFSGEAVADADRSNGNWRGSNVQVGRIGFPEETTKHGFPRGDEWRVEPDVGRVAHGIPARVDRLKGLGNAIVPQIAEWIGRRIVDAERLLEQSSEPQLVRR